MAVQPWMRSVWFRVAVGILAVGAIANGLVNVLSGVGEMTSGQQAPAGPAVPGYGPPINMPSQQQPSYAPVPNQAMPIATTNNPGYDQSPGAYPPAAPNNPGYDQSPGAYPPATPNTAYPNNAPPEAQRFRDPQGRFSVAVPQGWNAVPQNTGVVIIAGNAFAVVSSFDGSASSEQVVSTLSRQYGAQWRNLSVVTQGQTMLSGAPGAYVLLRGQTPRGVESLLRIAGVSSGGQAWAIILSAPLQEFNQASPLLQQIEMSFAVGNR